MASRRPGRRGCREKSNGGNLGRDYTGGATLLEFLSTCDEFLSPMTTATSHPASRRWPTALRPARRGHDRRAPDRSQRGRTRADAAAAAPARADPRAGLLRRRHADRLRQPRHRRGPRRPARPRRLRHQQGAEYRRRRDVFGHGAGRARRRAARLSGDRGVAAIHERGVGLRARGRGGGRRSRARCSSSRCRPGRFST